MVGDETLVVMDGAGVVMTMADGAGVAGGRMTSSMTAAKSIVPQTVCFSPRPISVADQNRSPVRSGHHVDGHVSAGSPILLSITGAANKDSFKYGWSAWVVLLENTSQESRCFRCVRSMEHIHIHIHLGRKNNNQSSTKKQADGIITLLRKKKP